MNLSKRTPSPLTPALSGLPASTSFRRGRAEAPSEGGRGEGEDSHVGRKSAPLAVQRSNRGSAVMVVLVLLGVMAVLVIANTTTLHQLRQELDQIDKQQQKK